MTVYVYKSKPYAHQDKLFNETWSQPAYGLLWEQGCGKTKPTIDTAARLFEAGEIDALVVVAPNGVHRNWISDELPAHLPDRVKSRSMALYLQTDKMGRTPAGNIRPHQKELERLMAFKGLAILTVSYDGFITTKDNIKDPVKRRNAPDKGREFMGKFMRARRCLMVVDESHSIKNPTALRTKTLMAARKFAPYRRILTGTPVAQGPFDLYSQMRFLDENFWAARGFPDFECFKNHFGVFQLKDFGMRTLTKVCVAYKNLGELHDMITAATHRLTKADALDLPPKVYSKRYYDMTAEQFKAYQDLKEVLFTELHTGAVVEAPLAIVKLLRFQQIVCGYAGDTEGNLVRLKSNPRLELLKEVVEQTEKAGIIWARFTEDVNQIMELLGDTAVRYDGSTSADERAIAKERFQKGEVKWFVGNQAAGATGLTLTQAKTVIYYSNSFKLVDRLQSEDRAHRIGQDEAVNYIDLVCSDSVDERIVGALRAKLDIATTITGDTLKEWI